LEDEDEWFREEAVEALGEIGGNSAIRLLEQALSDEYDGVRDTAEELLEELRQDSSEP
jgi:HEAT repeat protein